MPRGKKNVNEEIKVNTNENLANKYEKYEEQISDKEDKKQKTKSHVELIKRLKDEDPYVLIYCNKGQGVVNYDCPVTNKQYIHKYGDMEYMPYSALDVMNSRHPKMFTNYLYIPIAVDSEEFELQEILKLLKIQDLYSEEMLDDGNIDYILLNLNYNTFVSLINDMKNNPKRKPYAERILNRSIELAKTGEFADYGKMNYLKELSLNIGLSLKGDDMYELAIENYRKHGDMVI